MPPIQPTHKRCPVRPPRRDSHHSWSSSGASSDSETEGPHRRQELKRYEELCLDREYTSLTQKIQCHMDSGDPFFSLEFFPPRTENGVANLLKRMERMEQGGPLFVDVTWHPSGDPANSDKVTSSSHIAGACLDFCYHETMLHLTCAQYTREQNLAHLARAKQLGIRNIMALRGDLPEDEEEREKLPKEFNYATDLVRLIREEYDDYFTIAVAGYPCGHPEAGSYHEDLMHLREKCEAGADFIVTQMFFEVEDFFRFVKDCRHLDITVPIIPGFMPIQSYDSLRHIVRLSKLSVPQWIKGAMEPIRGNEEAIRNFGIHQGTQMLRKLLQPQNNVPGIHFYTLNREIATREILQNLDMWSQPSLRVLPWKAHTSHARRCKEEIRPIFWSERPKAYIYRTKHWNEFPRGTWTINSIERYGDLQDYYMFYLKDKAPDQDLRDMWGEELRREEDVWHMFTCFIAQRPNKQGKMVTRTPWNYDEISTETGLILNELEWCDSHGILTVNSQPNVNGADSDDPVLGWGRPGGYIYRKAYLEFFLHKDRVPTLVTILKRDYPNVSYHILNEDMSMEKTNNASDKAITVTWGVHPGAEVQQTTVVDPVSFRVWKDEAFECWREWAKIYPAESGSRGLLNQIRQDYCLANLVDNDYPRPSCLYRALRECVEVEDRERQKLRIRRSSAKG